MNPTEQALKIREMLVSILRDLNSFTDSKQYVNIQLMATHEQAQYALNEIVVPMIHICSTFNYIPVEEQGKIIRQGIIEDQDFYGMKAKNIWRYLNAASGKYFKQDAHKPIESNAKAVTYDQLTPETREAFDMFVKGLQSDKTGLKSVPEVTQAEIDAIKIEDLEQREGQHGIKYPSTTAEDISRFKRKIEWAQLHTDLQTGKVKEGSPTFEAWLSENTP